MGAETVVYARVLKHYEEWIEVQAVTLDEAFAVARQQPNVSAVLEVSYEPGGVVT